MDQSIGARSGGTHDPHLCLFFSFSLQIEVSPFIIEVNVNKGALQCSLLLEWWVTHLSVTSTGHQAGGCCHLSAGKALQKSGEKGWLLLMGSTQHSKQMHWCLNKHSSSWGKKQEED